MGASETDSAIPSLVVPGEVVRLEEDHKIMAREVTNQENAELISNDNTVVLEPSQSFHESHRKAPPGANPVVSNPYRNPRVYNPYNEGLDRYRTGICSREQNYTAPQSNTTIEAAILKIPGAGMAVPIPQGQAPTIEKKRIATWGK